MKKIITGAVAKVKSTVKSMAERKEAGIKAIVVELLLLVVAAAICIVFREQIGTVITNLLDEVSSRIVNVFN